MGSDHSIPEMSIIQSVRETVYILETPSNQWYNYLIGKRKGYKLEALREKEKRVCYPPNNCKQKGEYSLI